MGRLQATHSGFFRLCRVGSVKLTDRHRLEAIRERCGTSSLELMVRRRTLQWMGHVLRKDDGCLPRQFLDCSFVRSVEEDGCVEQLKIRPGHRNIKHYSGMTALQSRGAMRKVPVMAPFSRTFREVV
eukprot:364542-Chlamydomonas_euryale.AAC.16